MIRPAKKVFTVRVMFPADCGDLMKKWAVDTIGGKQLGYDELILREKMIIRTYSFSSPAEAHSFVDGLWTNIAMNVSVIHMNV